MHLSSPKDLSSAAYMAPETIKDGVYTEKNYTQNCFDYHLIISTNNKSINNTVKRIGNFKTITIPSTVTLIEPNSFLDYHCLEKINIPDSVKTIGANAFNGCGCLNAINIPSSVKVIENNVFSNCYRSKTKCILW